MFAEVSHGVGGPRLRLMFLTRISCRFFSTGRRGGGRKKRGFVNYRGREIDSITWNFNFVSPKASSELSIAFVTE